MNCINPIRIKKKDDTPKGVLFNKKYPDGLEVPCGKCIACKIKRRNEWSARMLHELDDWENAIFITLTYGDKWLPKCGLVRPIELQHFFKRLRKTLRSIHYVQNYNEKERWRIKYFACGEYGDNSNRPHYHAIIFGMSLCDFDKKIINACWKYGFVSYGLAEHDSINYVAKYVDKNAKGYDIYKKTSFRLSSQGLGKEYCVKNAEQILTQKNITLRGKNISIPRYYLKMLGVDNAEMLGLSEEAIKADKRTIEHYTKLEISDDDYYKHSTAEEYRRLNDAKLKAKNQHQTNLIAKSKLNKSKI